MMKAQDFEALEGMIAKRAFGLLKETLADTDRSELAEAWPRFKPLDKLVLFKLLDAQTALDFYTGLPFKERYYLLCGFPLDSIAPVLEAAPAADRRLFVQLPREFYDRMFRQLISERVVVTLPLRNN